MKLTYLFMCLMFTVCGCAMDAVVIKWHDGKTIRIDGGAKSLVKIKLKDGEVEVDNRKVSTLQTLTELIMFKATTDTNASARR